MTVIPQTKIANNSILEKSLVDFSMKNQLDDPTKTLKNS